MPRWVRGSARLFLRPELRRHGRNATVGAHCAGKNYSLDGENGTRAHVFRTVRMKIPIIVVVVFALDDANSVIPSGVQPGPAVEIESS